jgi:hypothetical protein
MGVSTQPLTLTPEQIEELHSQLGEMRHSVNNHLSQIAATSELLLIKPESRERLVANLAGQPAKITWAITLFVEEFERAMGIPRKSRDS